MRQRKLLAVAATATLALALAVPAHASGHGQRAYTRLTTLTTDVFAPFNLDVARRGIFVADGGTNVVSRLEYGGGGLTPIVTDAVGASGVAHHNRLLAYTTTVTDEATFENSASALNIKSPGGTVRADTLYYEQHHNPDAVNTYGFAHPTACQLEGLGPFAQYSGGVDSHAYSVAAYGDKWVVADAGGNDLLLVDNAGHVSTLAVLPPQPAVITEAFAESNGLDPDCFVGSTYGFEPVPTDVEINTKGRMFITTLPGGDESPDLGARGAVYRVNPATGHVTRVASGFSGATNLAIGPKGWIYVAELFGDQISVIHDGQVHPYQTLPAVVALEQTNQPDRLIAGTLDPAFSGPGSIVRIKVTH